MIRAVCLCFVPATKHNSPAFHVAIADGFSVLVTTHRAALSFLVRPLSSLGAQINLSLRSQCSPTDRPFSQNLSLNMSSNSSRKSDYSEDKPNTHGESSKASQENAHDASRTHGNVSTTDVMEEIEHIEESYDRLNENGPGLSDFCYWLAQISTCQMNFQAERTMKRTRNSSRPDKAVHEAFTTFYVRKYKEEVAKVNCIVAARGAKTISMTTTNILASAEAVGEMELT